MIKCPYCDSTYPVWPIGGKCLECGARKLEEVHEPILTQAQSANPPAINPVRKLKSGVFKTIGYRGVNFFTLILTLVLVVSIALAYFMPELRDSLWNKNVILAFVLIGLNLMLYRWSMIAVNIVMLLIAFSLV